MSDIFSEVDEEVRRERLKKIWERYGILIVGAAVLFVAAVAGWRGYEYWQSQKAAQAGSAFEEAILLSEAGKGDEAKAAFAKVAVDGTPSYRALAKLREAGETAKADPKAAVAIYDTVVADGAVNQVLRDLAAVRAGFLLADEAPLADLVKRLEPQTAADRAFRHSARLVLALSAWRANDVAALRRWSDMVTGDAETPQSIRGQVEMMSALTAGAKT